MNCPKCDQSGRRVGAVTLAHNILPEAVCGLGTLEGWWLCLSGADCSAVYFRDRDVVQLEQMRAVPFHKDSPMDRRVCFCFGYTESDIIKEVQLGGASRIQESIRNACRQGGEECRRLNPKGHCCLGDVGAILEQAH